MTVGKVCIGVGIAFGLAVLVGLVGHWGTTRELVCAAVGVIAVGIGALAG